jgi:hypothetical protein
MSKDLDIKIRETKDLAVTIWLFSVCHCLSHDYASCGVGTRLDVTGVGCGGMWKSEGRSEPTIELDATSYLLPITPHSRRSTGRT